VCSWSLSTRTHQGVLLALLIGVGLAVPEPASAAQLSLSWTDNSAGTAYFKGLFRLSSGCTCGGPWVLRPGPTWVPGFAILSTLALLDPEDLKNLHGFQSSD
jgi:hypothetical protein